MRKAHNALPDRILSVMRARLKEGHTTRSIADDLCCSPDTVHAYKKKWGMVDLERSTKCRTSLTDEKAKEIDELLLQPKLSFRAISNITGTTQRTVQRRATKMAPETLPDRPPNGVAPTLRRAAEDMLRNGQTVMEIRRQTGLSCSNIRYYARKLGINPPSVWEATNRRIVELIEYGWGNSDIATFLEVSRKRVSDRRKGCKASELRVESSTERSQIRGLCQAGKSEYEIADELALDPDVVRRVLNRKVTKSKLRKKSKVPKAMSRRAAKLRYGYFERDGRKVLVPTTGEWLTRKVAIKGKPKSLNALDQLMQNERHRVKGDFTRVHRFVRRYPNLQWYKAWLLGHHAPKDVVVLSQSRCEKLSFTFDYIGILGAIGVSDGSFRALLTRFAGVRFARFVAFLYGASAPHGVYIPPPEVNALRVRLSLNGQLKSAGVHRSAYERWCQDQEISLALSEAKKGMPIHVFIKSNSWKALNSRPRQQREALLRFIERLTLKSALQDINRSPGFHQHIRHSAKKCGCLSDIDDYLGRGGTSGSNQLGYFKESRSLFIAPDWLWDFRKEANRRTNKGEISVIKEKIGEQLIGDIMLEFAVPRSKTRTLDANNTGSVSGSYDCPPIDTTGSIPMPHFDSSSVAHDLPPEQLIVTGHDLKVLKPATPSKQLVPLDPWHVRRATASSLEGLILDCFQHPEERLKPKTIKDRLDPGSCNPDSVNQALRSMKKKYLLHHADGLYWTQE